jgi:hypothetical protein
MPTESKNLKLAEIPAAEATAFVRANPHARVPAAHDIKMRICWATEEFLRTAKGAVHSLQQAVHLLETTTNFAGPRSATAWVIGLEDLQRRRTEIEALTTALEIVETRDAETSNQKGTTP